MTSAVFGSTRKRMRVRFRKKIDMFKLLAFCLATTHMTLVLPFRKMVGKQSHHASLTQAKRPKNGKD